jgi:hypothetical protein
MQKTISTYDEWQDVARAFSQGKFEVLIACGSAGLSKSFMMRSILDKETHWITGNASPFQLFCDGWQYSVENQFQSGVALSPGRLVIDDCDQLLAERAGLNLLKAFTQTDDDKLIGWNTASKELKHLGIPRQYHFSGQVCIISNDYHAMNKHLKAVIDRGLLVLCKFTAQEVHRNVGSWWPAQKSGKNAFDREVYTFLGTHLHLIAEPSMRYYLVGAQAKRAGLDWQGILFETFGLSEQHAVVHEIMSDPRLNGEHRIAEFTRATGMSRATYFRLQGELKGLEAGVPTRKRMRRSGETPLQDVG